MSNKYSKRRYNPGKPKICKTKPEEPIIIIPPVVWPPPFLCLTCLWLHHLAPYEWIPYAVTLALDSPPTFWRGWQTRQGWFMTAEIDVVPPGSAARINMNLSQGMLPQGASYADTDPLPHRELWTVDADVTNLNPQWSVRKVRLMSWACILT